MLRPDAPSGPTRTREAPLQANHLRGAQGPEGPDPGHRHAEGPGERRQGERAA